MSQDPTFDLIRSLSPNEKRFFRLQSGEEKNYLHVFDALDNMKEYDQEILKKRLKKKKLNISYEKNYLYNQILKSLRIYHTEASVKSKARAALDYVDVLLQKNLFDQALKLLKKNEAVFDVYENFSGLIALQDFEEAILHRTDGLSEQHVCDEFYLKRKGTLNTLQNLVDYRILERQLINLNHASQFFIPEEKLQKIKKHKFLVENKAESFDAQFRFFQMNAMIAIYEHDYKKEAGYFKEIITLINKHPEIREAHYKIYYVVALHNYINACFSCDDYAEAERVVDELTQLVITQNSNNGDLRCFALMDETNLYIQTGEIQKALKLIPKIQDCLKVFPQISVYNKSQLMYTAAIAYFMNKQYKESAKLLQLLIDEMKNSEYKDRQAFSRVLLLINYYEMGKFDMIDYVLNSTQRFFKSNDRYYKTEKALLDFLKRAAKNNKASIPDLEKLKHSLEQIFSDKQEASLLFLFDFISWVESRIAGVSFAGVVLEKIKLKNSQVL